MPGTAGIDFSATIAETSDELRRSLGRALPAGGHAVEDADSRALAAGLVACVLELGEAWPGDEDSRRRLVVAAVGHGRARRAQGASEDRLFGDYALLRSAIWQRVRTTVLEPGVASRMIAGVDAAIGLGTAAALRGFYQEVIARSGEWPLAIERLVWDWRYHADPGDY